MFLWSTSLAWLSFSPLWFALFFLRISHHDVFTAVQRRLIPPRVVDSPLSWTTDGRNASLAVRPAQAPRDRQEARHHCPPSGVPRHVHTIDGAATTPASDRPHPADRHECLRQPAVASGRPPEHPHATERTASASGSLASVRADNNLSADRLRPNRAPSATSPERGRNPGQSAAISVAFSPVIRNAAGQRQHTASGRPRQHGGTSLARIERPPDGPRASPRSDNSGVSTLISLSFCLTF